MSLAVATTALCQSGIHSDTETELLTEIESLSVAGSRNLLFGQRLSQLAALYQDSGRVAEAEGLYLQALPVFETSLGFDHPEVARCLSNLAEIYYLQGKFVKSWPLAGRALSIRERAVPRQHSDIARSLNNLAELYRELGDLGKAESHYLRALAILRRQKPEPEADFLAVILSNLGTLQANKGNTGRADSLFKEALRVLDEAPRAKALTRGSVLANLAQLRSSAAKHAEAERLWRLALATVEGPSGGGGPLLHGIVSGYADALRRANRFQEAVEIEKRLR